MPSDDHSRAVVANSSARLVRVGVRVGIRVRVRVRVRARVRMVSGAPQCVRDHVALAVRQRQPLDAG